MGLRRQLHSPPMARAIEETPSCRRRGPRPPASRHTEAPVDGRTVVGAIVFDRFPPYPPPGQARPAPPLRLGAIWCAYLCALIEFAGWSHLGAVDSGICARHAVPALAHYLRRSVLPSFFERMRGTKARSGTLFFRGSAVEGWGGSTFGGRCGGLSRCTISATSAVGAGLRRISMSTCSTCSVALPRRLFQRARAFGEEIRWPGPLDDGGARAAGGLSDTPGCSSLWGGGVFVAAASPCDLRCSRWGRRRLCCFNSLTVQAQAP